MRILCHVISVFNEAHELHVFFPFSIKLPFLLSQRAQFTFNSVTVGGGRRRLLATRPRRRSFQRLQRLFEVLNLLLLLKLFERILLHALLHFLHPTIHDTHRLGVSLFLVEKFVSTIALPHSLFLVHQIATSKARLRVCLLLGHIFFVHKPCLHSRKLHVRIGTVRCHIKGFLKSGVVCDKRCRRRFASVQQRRNPVWSLLVAQQYATNTITPKLRWTCHFAWCKPHLFWRIFSN
mmetsp:Transcript_23217/g.37187  ORF Transcript_23217/g.37187 Transcript_23217/m.37187 type:complete len:235 (-) Transcript_23217:1810-2514(-)